MGCRFGDNIYGKLVSRDLNSVENYSDLGGTKRILYFIPAKISLGCYGRSVSTVHGVIYLNIAKYAAEWMGI